MASNPPPLFELPVTALRGIGERQAEKLAQLDVRTVQDVLFHLPYRYEDRTRLLPIGALHPGTEAMVAGTIEMAQVRFGRRRSLMAYVRDGSGGLWMRLFHFSGAQQSHLVKGARVRCYGEVRAGPTDLEMVHPEYRILRDDEEPAAEPCLTPVYPGTQGVSQHTLRRISGLALELMAQRPPPELLPSQVLDAMGLPSLVEALHTLHRPPPDIGLQDLVERRHPTQQRLAFEELMAHQLILRSLRKQVQHQDAPILAATQRHCGPLLEGLPFDLTGAQQRVWAEIARDLDRPHPMHRLLQGDVGSGKTVVAVLTLLRAVENDCQAALMAPTELLAEQHWQTLEGWLAPLGIPTTWLSGKLGARARKTALADLAAGHSRVVVGTHALFQDEVHFERLGAIVVDEQHRFGVHQRLALRRKGENGGLRPHQLIMTATPIPRTLAMTAYADLDVSVLDELPAGRRPVDTVAVPEGRRDDVIERIRAACAGGRQAYWVCTLVEESEALEAEAATDTAGRLAAALPEVQVGLVHGRMGPAEKQAAMAGFKAGHSQLLVATTVIEVGVDVPRASLMIIENAERLGLAQLHQLRGRVGRGSTASSCVLLYKAPLSDTARERLAVMRETNDGFRIAQRDLELRGPGEVLGTRQTGLARLRVADLVRDAALLPRVEEAGTRLLAHHPERVAPLIRRWIGDGLHYADV